MKCRKFDKRFWYVIIDGRHAVIDTHMNCIVTFWQFPWEALTALEMLKRDIRNHCIYGWLSASPKIIEKLGFALDIKSHHGVVNLDVQDWCGPIYL